jgi:predicted acylesterase/phospholipase RssA
MMPPEVYGQHLLVDGGVLDNMPVNAMRNLGAETIIGSDVSPQTYMNADYPSGRLPSGWRVLWHKLMPHLKPIASPTIFDVIMRLVTLNDVKTRGAVSEQCDLLIKPPVEPFGMLEFTAIDRMIDLGYQQTMEDLEAVGEDHPLRAYRDKKN